MDEIAKHFKDAAASLLAEAGFATVEMTNSRGHSISPGDVMFTVSKLEKMSQKDAGELTFDGDVGKVQANHDSGNIPIECQFPCIFLTHPS